MIRVLTVGDTHINDTQSLTRFNIISNFIIAKKPDYIVLTGDFMTLQCLSAWDKDKRTKMENRRYAKEMKAGNKALDMMMEGVRQHNNHMKKLKMKQYKPVTIYVEGNHEDRLTRYLECDPTFEGMVSIEKDLNLVKRGILFVPYREYHYIDEVGFTHIPHNKSAAIGGVDITRKASMVTVSSVVFSHTHNQNMSHVFKEGMSHLQDIYCAGCFFEEKEDYIKGRVTEYWRGLSILHIWKPGRFDVEAYSLGRLKREYNGRQP